MWLGLHAGECLFWQEQQHQARWESRSRRRYSARRGAYPCRMARQRPSASFTVGRVPLLLGHCHPVGAVTVSQGLVRVPGCLLGGLPNPGGHAVEVPALQRDFASHMHPLPWVSNWCQSGALLPCYVTHLGVPCADSLVPLGDQAIIRRKPKSVPRNASETLNGSSSRQSAEGLT
jgi:hypothetical protein